MVDAINTTPKYFAHSASNNIKIVIPKIVGNGKNIEVLNKTILDEIISYMIVPLESEDDVANNGYTDSKYLSEFTKCNNGNDEITNCSIDHIKKVINENHNCTYIDIDNNDLKVYFDDFCN